MTRATYLYPWDLEDEGAETVLPRLRDVGIDAVSLTVSYHASKFVRPHATPRVQIMLGICFCDACLATASAAGIVGHAVSRRNCYQPDLVFTDGTEPASDPQTDPESRAFNAFRANVVMASAADEVRSAVTQLDAAGAASISFYNYGHMRLKSLDWIAAALT